ncbi:MAG: hypothetical protein KUG76_04195 [Gammaproteobacteria bacterium]|nr:hypothetical protein [Gammaproteobacteria bacterium]
MTPSNKVQTPRTNARWFLSLLLLMPLSLLQHGCTLAPSSTVNIERPLDTTPELPISVTDILELAQSLSESNHSTEASRLIQDSLLFYPQDPQLESALITYQKLSDEEIYSLTSDALINHALWIRSELRKEKAQAIAKPSILKKIRISRLTTKQKHAHDSLILCARDNFQDDPELSQRCLDTTNKTHLTEEQFQSILALRQQLREQETSKINAAFPDTSTAPESEQPNLGSSDVEAMPPPSSNDFRSEIEQTTYSLRMALKQRDYLLAKQLSSSLKNNSAASGVNIKKLIKHADKKIRRYTAKISLRADELYLQERVAEADALWVILIKLHPRSDEYRQNHERAERILKNIKTIKENQANEASTDLTLEAL